MRKTGLALLLCVAMLTQGAWTVAADAMPPAGSEEAVSEEQEPDSTEEQEISSEDADQQEKNTTASTAEMQSVDVKDSTQADITEEQPVNEEELQAASDVGGFVDRLYKVCLGRKADAAGRADWIRRLSTHQIGGAEAAAGFAFSEEFQNMNYCNNCFVDSLYECLMGRTADAAGKAGWLRSLANGSTRGEVFNGFARSDEFGKICAAYGINRGSGDWSNAVFVITGNCQKDGTVNRTVQDFVTRLYEVCLNREPDAAGLASWVNGLRKGATGQDTAYGFIFSREFTGRKLSDEAFVDALYQALFGRKADSAGRKDWVRKLSYQGMPREEVFYGFTNSREFKILCAQYGIIRGNKTYVAPAFTGKDGYYLSSLITHEQQRTQDIDIGYIDDARVVGSTIRITGRFYYSTNGLYPGTKLSTTEYVFPFNSRTIFRRGGGGDSINMQVTEFVRWLDQVHNYLGANFVMKNGVLTAGYISS